VPADWRTSFYYHYYEKTTHHVAPHRGVRTARYTLAHYYETDEWELFDLQKDPRQMRSVYGDAAYAPVVSELKAELGRLRRQFRDEPDPVLPYCAPQPSRNARGGIGILGAMTPNRNRRANRGSTLVARAARRGDRGRHRRIAGSLVDRATGGRPRCGRRALVATRGPAGAAIRMDGRCSDDDGRAGRADCRECVGSGRTGERDSNRRPADIGRLSALSLCNRAVGGGHAGARAPLWFWLGPRRWPHARRVRPRPLRDAVSGVSAARLLTSVPAWLQGPFVGAVVVLLLGAVAGRDG
jgi:hypothetical protein